MLKELKINQNSIEVAYPRFKNFILKLRYLPRDEIAAIREKAATNTYNRLTRQREDVVDTDKFMDEYIKKALVGWSGLTYEVIVALVPVEVNVSLDTEVEYTHENAMWLVKNSTEFDSFISDTMNQVDLFSVIKKEETLKK